MDATIPPNNANFKGNKRVFLRRCVLILLIVVAALCIIIVGLMVGYRLLKKPPPEVRLPRSVVPEHYDLELQPYIIPDNFTFDGKVKIVIKILEPTYNVTLHVSKLKVDTKSVKMTNAQSGTEIQISFMIEDTDTEFYILHFSKKLKARTKYEIYMEFVGYLNDDLDGFYRSSYTDSDGNKRWLATTKFQPTSARRAFPCFDEPAMKATFNITLVRWSNMTSLSNMPIVKSEDRGEDWVADHFQRTVRMSTYLLAFIVSDFKSAGTPEFSIWSRKEILNTTAYALDIGPKMLKFYESFFSVPYPLPKMDMVAIPDFRPGAMENWGLIMYRETSLLYDKKYSSAMDKQMIAVHVAHELAHQWFGNLVTPAWWDDLWLNEGFGSFLEYSGVHAIHPDWKMDEQFVLAMQNVMKLDCLKTSHPISLPVRHPDEINDIFDNISYEKGSSIIRMMKYFLGDKNFRKGLSNFLKAKKFDSAVQDDLWKHMTDVQNKKDRIDVKAVMDTWTLQTGYPVVKVIRDYATGTAKVKQYRFLLEKEGGNNDQYQWEIPFTFTDGLNPDWTPTTKLWLHKTNGTINRLPGANYWIIGNVQEVGYYRVNYDDNNWKLLAKQMLTNHKKIHTVNRAQIIDDSMDLARAGQLNYSLSLNITMYLKDEKEFLPWKSALETFTFIDSMICRSAVYGKWKNYLMKQLKPMYESLGWEESSDENILKQYSRESTLNWMCHYGYKDCVKKALEKFDQWKQDPSNTNIIPPNLRYVVFCTAVRDGGQKAWDFIWDKYKESQIASEREKFMNALACTREPWLLTRYLDWSLTADSDIRSQDKFAVFYSVGKNLFGRDLTFNYMKDKWDIIYDTFDAISLLGHIASTFNTRFELAQLKELYDLNKYDMGREFEQSMEEAKANVKWMDNYYKQLEYWLDISMKDQH